MSDTAQRLLRLLSLLQTPRDWSGPELAERLGVTARTVRNDVERLRGLGYPVQGIRGVTGGYRLGAGAELPPLLLDDEEAVAVAVGLRVGATQGAVTGIEETALRALTKLEQMLPSRLRRRVDGLRAHLVRFPRRVPVWTPTRSPRSRRPRATMSGSGSTTPVMTGRPGAARSSRTASRTAGGVGIWWDGTSPGPTGAPSGWTGCGCGHRTARGSLPGGSRRGPGRPCRHWAGHGCLAVPGAGDGSRVGRVCAGAVAVWGSGGASWR